ncbi:MAG: hypothetical protein ACOH5I_20495 [Oligoflexus sp.]
MKSPNAEFWFLSTREMTNKVDLIHLWSIAFYLIFPIIVVIGNFFQVGALLQIGMNSLK